jgi:hypothetical protein
MATAPSQNAMRTAGALAGIRRTSCRLAIAFRYRVPAWAPAVRF